MMGFHWSGAIDLYLGIDVHVPDDRCFSYRTAVLLASAPGAVEARVGLVASVVASPFVCPPIVGSPAGHLRTIASQPCNLLLVDRKSTRLNSSHVKSPYAVSCLKK